MAQQAKTPIEADAKRPPVHYDTTLPKLTMGQRLQIPILGWLVWAVIRVLGPTLRFEVQDAIIGPISLLTSTRSGIAASLREPGISEIAAAY
jgi:hypothetical protein